jgi:hypothetical protein
MGEAWEPSYKTMLFSLPKIKCLSLFPGFATFIYPFIFYPTLSLFPELPVFTKTMSLSHMNHAEKRCPGPLILYTSFYRVSLVGFLFNLQI